VPTERLAEVFRETGPAQRVKFMSTHEAFLQTILAAPGDDTPRLIYADWLEEHGTTEAERARAEFIRVQCELARLGNDDPSRLVLEQRENELLTQHERNWAQDIHSILAEIREGIMGATRAPFFWRFERGFIESIECHGALLIRHAARLFARAPIRRLRIDGPMSQRAALSALPELARLTALELTDPSLNSKDVRALASSPYVANLTTLHINKDNGATAWVKDAGTTALAKSPHLARLRELGLRANNITVKGAAALATSPHLTRLTSLDLALNGLGDEGVQALAGSPVLANITRLDLKGNKIGPAGCAALASSPYLADLRWLNLEWNRLDPTAAEAIVNSPNLARLRTLLLAECEIGTEGVCALAAWPHLTHLEELDLTRNEVDGRAVAALLASPKLTACAVCASVATTWVLTSSRP
jgi:uncharacterized protein (TIGR02996 family)